MSLSYELSPLTKTVEAGVPHYRWGITYKTVDGFFFKANVSYGGFAFKARIDYLRFEYDFYIKQNASYTKTSFSMSDFASIDSDNTSSPAPLEGLSLSLLYTTSTSSPRPCATYINGEPYDSTVATETATATPSSQIIVENTTAYEFLFDENYNLTQNETTQSYEVRSEAAATSSLSPYMGIGDWLFNDLENVLNLSALFPSVRSTDGRLYLECSASHFLYRICYPVWEGGAIEHDPTNIAYFQAVATVPGPSDENGKGDQSYTITWILIATAATFVAGAGLFVYFKKRRRLNSA